MSSSTGSKFLRWLRVHVFVRACVRTRRLPWSPACFAPVHLRSCLLSLACVFLTACLLHCYTPLFDSNIFASYMLGLDARELAYSNFIQVIRSKTMEGFVPNFAAATRKSEDRTEPPIGAKVLLEMYRRWGSADNWLVELLFDDLLDWSNWFLRDRLQPPLNLISLGGDGMQGARFESGLDNSPMYDGNFYNDSSHHMLLYDVGMSSMFVMEADALAELAAAIDRPEAQMLRQRAASMRTNIGQHLWDEESGAFVNKFSENGTFYRRISPTSFYSMLAGAATDAQARTMATV